MFGDLSAENGSVLLIVSGALLVDQKHWLALAYLESRKARTCSASTLADVTGLHRQEHARALLEEACQLVLQTRDLQQVYDRHTLAA
jgi:hypothetical protein